MSLSVISNSSNSWETVFHCPLKIKKLKVTLLEEVASYLTSREVRSSLIFFSKRIAYQIRGYPSPCRAISFAVNDKNLFLELSEFAKLLKCEEQISLCDFAPDTNFQRDFFITLPNGHLLFPKSYPSDFVKSVRFKSFMLACYDQSMHHILQGVLKTHLMGRGFRTEYQQETLKLVRDKQFTIVQSRCCLEGGNVIFFQNSLGIRKAIVGMHSLVLTFVFLHEEGYFDDKLDDLPTPLTVTDEAFLMARNNLYFFQHNRKCRLKRWDKNVFLQFVEKLKTPLSSQEKEDLLNEAIKMEKKLSLTKALIAKELGMDVVFVPQCRFHIDMEISVFFDDTILVHDELLSLSVLNQHVKKGFNKETPIYQDFIVAAQQRIKTYSCSETVRRLKNFGCKVVLVAGIFESTLNDLKLNFMRRCCVNQNIK